MRTEDKIRKAYFAMMSEGRGMIERLDDLLEGESPRSFARSVYKEVDCGPWVRYIVERDGKRTSSEDCENTDECVGIEVGSIVEGSDVEIGPFSLMFPFPRDKFWKTIEKVNEQACFYWERDNT